MSDLSLLDRKAMAAMEASGITGRQYALRLYGYKCADCGKSEGRLNLHHADGDTTKNIWDNLVMVCVSCHRIRHVILKAQKYTCRQIGEMKKKYKATFSGDEHD